MPKKIWIFSEVARVFKNIVHRAAQHILMSSIYFEILHHDFLYFHRTGVKLHVACFFFFFFFNSVERQKEAGVRQWWVVMGEVRRDRPSEKDARSVLSGFSAAGDRGRAALLLTPRCSANDSHTSTFPAALTIKSKLSFVHHWKIIFHCTFYCTRL